MRVSMVKSAVLSLLLLALAPISMAQAAPATTEDPVFVDWFRPGPAARESWIFADMAGDPRHLIIRKRAPKAQARGPLRRIFVLFPRASSAYDVAMTKILQVYADKHINAEFTVVNFDNQEALGLKALAEAKSHDLIFSMGSQSTAWLWENYRGGAVPVISVCSKDPVVLGQAESYKSGTGSNFAFTSLNMPIEVQMAYVLELKPDLKNLAVLVDSQNISAVQTQAEPIAEYARGRGIRVLNVAVENPENAATELSTKVRRAVATMRKNDPTLNNSIFWITGSTAVFREIRAINENSDRVPVLSVVPEVVAPGDDSAVMSIGISFQSNAHLAAIYGIDVLDGRAKVGDLKVGIVSPPDIAINFRKAQEIALDIPFTFFESASLVYDYEGRLVRDHGKAVAPLN